jgi:hypothetical protein
MTRGHLGREVSGAELKSMFWKEYVDAQCAVAVVRLLKPRARATWWKCRAKLMRERRAVEISG